MCEGNKKKRNKTFFFVFFGFEKNDSPFITGVIDPEWYWEMKG